MSIPESVLREIDRAIQAAEFPRGMSVHDGKAKVHSSHLRRLLAELATLRAQFDAAEKARCHAVMLNGDYTEELAALRVEHERLKGDYSEEAVHLRTRAERAEAEAAGLRADAERWRAVSAMMTHEHRADAVGWTLGALLPGDDPDAAIDAARGES